MMKYKKDEGVVWEQEGIEGIEMQIQINIPYCGAKSMQIYFIIFFSSSFNGFFPVSESEYLKIRIHKSEQQQKTISTIAMNE